MIFLISVVSFIIGLYIGLKVQNALYKHIEENEKKKVVDKANSIYLSLINQMMRGKVSFVRRMNQICYLTSELEDEGVVELVYMIDKKDLAIFKDGKCIYTSDLVNKETLSKISTFIESHFRNEISDVVNILGFVISKNEFEKTFHIKLEDFNRFKDQMNLGGDSSSSHIQDIITSNKVRFDIDEILDKISATGIHSLTLEERLFLDNYSNEKRS
jgi:hypothetical protein